MWSQVAKCLLHISIRHTLMQRVFHYDEGDSSLMEVWVTEGWHISCSIRCRNSTSTTSGDPLCNRTKLCAIFWSKRRPKIKFRAIQQWVKHGKPNPNKLHLDAFGSFGHENSWHLCDAGSLHSLTFFLLRSQTATGLGLQLISLGSSKMGAKCMTVWFIQWANCGKWQMEYTEYTHVYHCIPRFSREM